MKVIEVNIAELPAGTLCYLKVPFKDKASEAYKVVDRYYIVNEISGDTVLLSSKRTTPTVYVNTTNYSTNELEGFLKSTFNWGPVTHVHLIGDFQIVEHHPQIYNGYRGTGKYDFEKTEFSVYRDWKTLGFSAKTLDAALVLAIAHKYEGANSQAGHYFSKMIGLEEH